MPLTRGQRERGAPTLDHDSNSKANTKASFQTNQPSSSRPAAPEDPGSVPNPQTNANRRITRRTAAILDSHNKYIIDGSTYYLSKESSKGKTTLLSLPDGLLCMIFNHIEQLERVQHAKQRRQPLQPAFPPYYTLRYTLPMVCKRFNHILSQPSCIWNSIELFFASGTDYSVAKEMQQFQAPLFQRWLKSRAQAVKRLSITDFRERIVHLDFIDTWAALVVMDSTVDEKKKKEQSNNNKPATRQSRRLQSAHPNNTSVTIPCIISILKMLDGNLCSLTIKDSKELLRDNTMLKSILEAVPPKLEELTLCDLPPGIDQETFKPLSTLNCLTSLSLDVPQHAGGNMRPLPSHSNPLHYLTSGNSTATSSSSSLSESQRLIELSLVHATRIEIEHISSHLRCLNSLKLIAPTIDHLNFLSTLDNLTKLAFADTSPLKTSSFTDKMWLCLYLLSNLETLEIYSTNRMKLHIRKFRVRVPNVSKLVIKGCAMDAPMAVRLDDNEFEDDDSNSDDEDVERGTVIRTAIDAMEGLHLFPNLETLKILDSNLCSLLPPPGKMIHLPKLVTIDVSDNNLVDLPEQFLANVPALEYLYASGNQFPCIPQGVARLSHLKRLDLSNSMYMEVDGPLDWMLCSGPNIKKSVGYQYVGARQLYSYGTGEVENEEVIVQNMTSLEWMKLTKSNLFQFKESSIDWLVDVRAKFLARGQEVDIQYT